MISLIIPTYRNPKYLDICLKSAIEGQNNTNEIIVAVDGYVEESKDVIAKYKDKIQVLLLEENQGMQTALNLGVYNCKHDIIFIINDDNVLPTGWDTTILSDLKPNEVLTLNQIEPIGPGIFNFPVKDFGSIDNFEYEKFLLFEKNIKEEKITPDGGIFPFAMWKNDYMIVGGFDTLYQSPFICDWDFFLKLDLNGKKFKRTHRSHLYHFGSTATKNGKEGDKFKASETPAAQTFMYKWGIPPQLFENNSHRPKGKIIKGIKF